MALGHVLKNSNSFSKVSKVLSSKAITASAKNVFQTTPDERLELFPSNKELNTISNSKNFLSSFSKPLTSLQNSVTSKVNMWQCKLADKLKTKEYPIPQELLEKNHINHKITYRLLTADDESQLQSLFESPLNSNCPRPEEPNLCVKKYLNRNYFSPIFGGCLSLSHLEVYRQQLQSICSDTNLNEYVMLIDIVPENAEMFKVNSNTVADKLGFTHPFPEQNEILHVATGPNADYRPHIIGIFSYKDIQSASGFDILNCVVTGNQVPYSLFEV